MAGEAHPLFECFMFNISSALQRSGIMARHAESAAALNCVERLLGRRRIVTRLTGTSKNRAMGTCHEELCLRRGMRIMAAHAGFRLHRVSSMSLLERRIPALMTGKAEGGRRLYEQILLAGPM